MWERRTNQEVMELYGNEGIVGVAKSQRIRWLGHMERMTEHRMPKKILEATLHVTRRVGRPRNTWKKAVEEDLECLGIIGWKAKAKDRKAWKAVVKQAMGLNGP